MSQIKILAVANDIVDADNVGLPADVLRKQGYDVMIVMMEGCPALAKVQKDFPDLHVELVHGMQDVGRFSPTVVLASMVETEFLRGLMVRCHTSGVPVVMVQDRPKWRLSLWHSCQPTALCVVSDYAAEIARTLWGIERCTFVPRTGMPYFDILYRQSHNINSGELREKYRVRKDDFVVHLACDKFGAPGMALAVTHALSCPDLKGAHILPSIHPVASAKDKEQFWGIFEGASIIRGEFSPVERMMISDVTVASIVSGMLDQTSALGRIPIGFAGEFELKQLKGYSGLTNPEEHPLVETGTVVPACDPDGLRSALNRALKGELDLNPLPPPTGRSAENVALIVSSFV